jgi:hypothetical protein
MDLALLGGGITPVPTWANDLKVGLPARPSVLHALDGRSIATRELLGQVVIVTFWATWVCPLPRGIAAALGLCGTPCEARSAGTGFQP